MLWIKNQRKGNEGPGILNPAAEETMSTSPLSSKTLFWGKGEADKRIPQKRLKIPCQILDWDTDKSQGSFMVLAGIHPEQAMPPNVTTYGLPMEPEFLTRAPGIILSPG